MLGSLVRVTGSTASSSIGNSHVYGATAEYVFSDLKTRGWIMLIAGGLSSSRPSPSWAASELARRFGIGVAGLNASCS